MTTKEEPTKSGDKPIEHLAGEKEMAAAEKKAAEQAQEAADARLYTGDSMTYTEYDAVGKGPDYEPSPERKAQNAAKDKAVADADADVNNLTPEQHEERKREAAEAKQLPAKS